MGRDLRGVDGKQDPCEMFEELIKILNNLKINLHVFLDERFTTVLGL